MVLINVVRILLSKLREGATTAGPFDSQSGEGAHIFKALRAALILFPLLGITNLLFFINPKNGSQQKIYMLFNATMQSSQVGDVRLYVWLDEYTILTSQYHLTVLLIIYFFREFFWQSCIAFWTQRWRKKSSFISTEYKQETILLEITCLKILIQHRHYLEIKLQSKKYSKLDWNQRKLHWL